MSWWTDESTGDTIGDTPADALMECLDSLSEEREEQGLEPLKLPELLAALAEALRRKTRDWCGPEQDTPFRALVARVLGPDSATTLVEQSPKADEDTVLRLCEAFEDLCLEYEDVLDRPPRRSELLTAMAFVLGHEPETWLELPPGCSVQAISTTPPASEPSRQAQPGR